MGDHFRLRLGNVRLVDLKGKTVIPGIIDAHNHIVLVGNRPGWHTPLEHVFTIPDAIAASESASRRRPAGEFITTIGPMSAMQFEERRLPNLTELDAVDRRSTSRPRRAARGRTARERRGLKPKASTVAVGRRALRDPRSDTALQTLRKELLTPETRKRSALGRAAVLRQARHHHASRLRRVSLGRAVRRRREREHLHDAQSVSRAPPRRKDAGAAADRLPAPGLAHRQPAAADALTAPEELVSVLRRRVDQDRRHRRVHRRRRRGPARDRQGRLARARITR